MNLKKIITYLKAHPAIGVTLNKLFDYSIANKQTIFNQNDFSKEYALLLKEGCVNVYLIGNI